MYVTADDGARIFAPAFGPDGGSGAASGEAPGTVAAPAPFVALGGWIADWQAWLPVFARLSGRRRVVGIDHRGSGATIAAPASITLERLVADIVAVLDAYGIDRCVLGSESMGAQAAIATALLHPDRVERLVLVAPLVGEDGGLPWRPGLRVTPPPPVADASADSPFEAAVRADFAGAKRRFVTVCLPEPDTDAIAHWAFRLLGGGTVESAITLIRLRRSLDLRPVAASVSQPALVIQGDLDALVTVASARALADSIPGARLSVLPGAGHAPTLTRPDEVARAIEAFLER